MYRLGLVENKQNREFGLFIFMLVGSIVGGILYWLTDFLDEAPREIFIVFAWKSSGFPIPYMHDTEQTTITSLRPDSRALVALNRSFSISSFIERSFSI